MITITKGFASGSVSFALEKLKELEVYESKLDLLKKGKLKGYSNLMGEEIVDIPKKPFTKTFAEKLRQEANKIGYIGTFQDAESKKKYKEYLRLVDDIGAYFKAGGK